MSEIHDFTLPDLGEGLEDGEILRWHVAVGDVIGLNGPVVEVETAKAVVDVPCPFAGRVVERHGEEGDTVPVGAVTLGADIGSTSQACISIAYSVESGTQNTVPTPTSSAGSFSTVSCGVRVAVEVTLGVGSVSVEVGVFVGVEVIVGADVGVKAGVAVSGDAEVGVGTAVGVVLGVCVGIGLHVGVAVGAVVGVVD